MFILVHSDFSISNSQYRISWSMFAEDEVTDSLSTATPCESMELDDEQAKRLLSSLDSTEDVSFVKGTQVK
jgi:hypothetical protein